MRRIRLTENQFNRLVSKCVKRALNEAEGGSGYMQSPKIGINNRLVQDLDIQEVSNGFYVSGTIKGVKCGHHFSYEPTEQEAIQGLFKEYNFGRF